MTTRSSVLFPIWWLTRFWSCSQMAYCRIHVSREKHKWNKYIKTKLKTPKNLVFRGWGTACKKVIIEKWTPVWQNVVEDITSNKNLVLNEVRRYIHAKLCMWVCKFSPKSSCLKMDVLIEAMHSLMSIQFPSYGTGCNAALEDCLLLDSIVNEFISSGKMWIYSFFLNYPSWKKLYYYKLLPHSLSELDILSTKSTFSRGYK